MNKTLRKHARFGRSYAHSPLHIDSQENVSEEEEGDEEGYDLQGISNPSALGWQGQVHNDQHKVHQDQYHTEYTGAIDRQTE